MLLRLPPLCSKLPLLWTNSRTCEIMDYQCTNGMRSSEAEISACTACQSFVVVFDIELRLRVYLTGSVPEVVSASVISNIDMSGTHVPTCWQAHTGAKLSRLRQYKYV